MVYPALEIAETLAAEGIELAVVNGRFVKPLDRELILALAVKTGRLITIEENVLQGGFGTAVLELVEEEGLDGVEVTRFGYPDRFIGGGSRNFWPSADSMRQGLPTASGGRWSVNMDE
jgi:1-deoxy-D-xylulose-5-phosphate synthase